MATYNINISDLATTLQNADANTVDTPHTINITEITQNDVDNGTIRTCLRNNPTKYVIINILAGSTVTDISSLFNTQSTVDNMSLVGADISALTNVTKAHNTFYQCKNLSSVNISGLNNLTSCYYMFYMCLSLPEIDTSSFRNVQNANRMFESCKGLTEIDASFFINVQNANTMFGGCSGLTEIDISSMSLLQDIDYMFAGCDNLETVYLADLSSINGAHMLFNNCPSLVEIHNWTIPANANLYMCFVGCTSLQAIYVPEVVPQESTWHAWDIQKDTANTRSDVTIYGTSGTPVIAQIPSSGTYSLEVSGMTDELLFSSTKAITSAHIQKMMQTQTPITGNTDALDPTKDNFVMLAKDRTAAKTNITTDVVEAGNLLPPTSAAVHAAIDANKSGGIPLGGWTSFENDTAPNDDWIQAGTTFDSDTYPELFLYLGGNTVPQMFDHSRLNETFDNTVDLSATTLENAYTCPYDGFIYWATNQISSTTNLRIYVNNTETFAWVQGSGTSEKQYGVLPVKKGDKVWHLGTATFEYHNARWYTHPLFIKATTTASSYTPSTAMQEIKDYTKDYVDASNSYSTEETLTGGTWIDGKPIYRRTFHFNTMLSVGQYVYTVNVGQADFDTWIKTYYIGRRSNMTDIMTANFPTWTANNYTGFKISVNDQEAMFVDYIILEYTKKTTP